MKENLLEENAQLALMIDKIKKQRESEEKEVYDLENQVSLMNTELKQVKSKGDQTNSGVTRLKQDRTDYQDRLVILFFCNLPLDECKIVGAACYAGVHTIEIPYRS